MRKVGVAAVGDVSDINCWSNIPFFFFKAGRDLGYFHEPWCLNMPGFRASRKIWNLGRLLTGNPWGGYQYSEAFLNKAERQIPPSYFSSKVISFNQLFPRASSVIKANGKMYYYIDITLNDLFREPEYKASVAKKIQSIAISQEKENYHNAEAVFTMGSWVSQSLEEFYKVPKSKIFHVLPGANIDLPFGFRTPDFQPGAGLSRDLVLGFIGKDWKRKGLLILLDVVHQLRKRGYRAKVAAMGSCPSGLRNAHGLEYSGFIDKQTDADKFIDFVTSCDIGCLFSSSEALGISVLEFLNLGVPVAGFYHQGLRDSLVENCSIRFDLADDATVIANRIIGIIEDGKLRTLKTNAETYVRQFTWQKAVSSFNTLMN